MRILLRFWFPLVALLSASLHLQATNLASSAETYQRRYDLQNVFEKRVDNYGQGDHNLYGTRNFRAVLPGVVYRGGANNKYHDTRPRSNMNPLPQDGLENLCEEGFGDSVHLYDKNYHGSTKRQNCKTRLGSTQTLKYRQHSVLSSNEARDAVLNLVHQKLTGGDPSPVYLHCWNGWHASGFISAIILRQFCGWSASEAVSYWNRNTDGHDSESGFESIRNRIRNFQPDSRWGIPNSTEAMICPQDH